MNGTHDNPKTRNDLPAYKTGDYVEMVAYLDPFTDEPRREVVQIDECLDGFQFSVRPLGLMSTMVVDGSRFRW